MAIETKAYLALRGFEEFFNQHKQKVTEEFVMRFSMFKIGFRFRWNVLRPHRGLEGKQESKLRHTFTLLAHIMTRRVRRVMHDKILEPFFVEYVYRENLKNKVLSLYRTCMWI